jgi:lipopolysaccharide heptosyltransferase II
MDVLIVKLGATGDVVRTTPLLRRLKGQITWVTSSKNKVLLASLTEAPAGVRALAWEDRSILERESFDLVINLEDDIDTVGILDSIRCDRVFGAYANGNGQMSYSQDASKWFDLSLISVYGRERADELKFQNRRTYQDLIFEGLGLEFAGERYLLPPTVESDLRGDVAIASEAGPVWPMKNWAHYMWLKSELESRGLKVNFLPTRATLLEHLADVRGHRCLVGGDSLPMHLALGSGVPCVALFNCTSPWEIYDYGILTKLVSPLLGEFFYKRGFDRRATNAISSDDVLRAVLEAIDSTVSA